MFDIFKQYIPFWHNMFHFVPFHDGLFLKYFDGIYISLISVSGKQYFPKTSFSDYFKEFKITWFHTARNESEKKINKHHQTQSIYKMFQKNILINLNLWYFFQINLRFLFTGS